MAVYTKRGDSGETSLYSQAKEKRVSKTSRVISVIGTIDEVNSFIGLVASITEDRNLIKTLQGIQSDLLAIGSIIAGSDLRLDQRRVNFFEKEIDKMESQLPLLKNFILPGGTPTAANLQYLRSLVRRAERSVVRLRVYNQDKALGLIMQYLNRLSDYIYTLARYENFKNGVSDIIWKDNSRKR
jgi:cob(I)alamin adenosyltransferase